MKKRSLSKYAFICVVLATLLLASSPVWAADSTELYYRIYDDGTPQLILADTETGKTDWYLIIDWPLTEVFSIYNSENNSNPFIIENGTAENLLYLDAAERIGINTNAPAEELDIRSTLPAIRLDDTSAGAGQVDLQMSTNEFAIEGNAGADIFQIDTRASFTMQIDQDEEVGIGTTAPQKKLHVYGSSSGSLSDSTITARIENVTGTTGSRHMLQLVNNGDPIFWFHNTANDARWSMNPIGNGFNWSKGGTGQFEMQLQGDGDLIIAGSLTQNSDRNMKEKIHAVDPNEVLRKVAELPISRWQYKHDEQKNRHMGPMAQDFYASFGLGRNDKGLSPGDLSGVALAAIKGLNAAVKDKDVKIVQLEGKVADLEKKLQAQQDQLARLSALEPVVARLVHQLGALGPMQVSFETTTPVENHSF